MIDSLSPNVCYDVTKPVFKQLRKTTSLKKSHNLKARVCVVGGWVVPGKNLDHSPTILWNVRILGSVCIEGVYPFLVEWILLR